MSELLVELTNRGIDPDVVTNDEINAAAEAVGATGMRSDIPRIADHVATRHYTGYQQAMEVAQAVKRVHTWHVMPDTAESIRDNTATWGCTCGWVSDPYPAEPRASAHGALITQWHGHLHAVGAHLDIDERKAACPH